MEVRILRKDQQNEVSSLVKAAFTSSEGAREGETVGSLAFALSSKIDDESVVCFGSYENEVLIGAIFFTRLQLTDTARIFMLSPVAVDTAYQGKGVGLSMINFGLNQLRNRSADVVVTYGDPRFYSKVGFQQLSEDVIRAPLELSMPEGWLGQSLTSAAIPTISERPQCVAEFNNPDLW